jgi:exoribonuclease R
VPVKRLRVAPDASEVLSGFERIRRAMDLPEGFPSDAQEEARAASQQDVAAPGYEDLTAIPFVTIDPPGSMDLDQAFHAERRGRGFSLHYAIADPGSFLEPDGPIDTEARHRGQTLYSPDGKIPLYPPVLGEGVASLLPNEVRRSVLWSLELDEQGHPLEVNVRRALVRSTRRLTYEEAQDEIEAGSELEVLRDVGRLREERERERGGMNLELPEQEIALVDGRFELRFRGPLPVEGWNAQVSLLTGMCAANLMLSHGVGLIRTMPPPDPTAIAAVRAVAAFLGREWPPEIAYADFMSSLDPSEFGHGSILTAATQLFRGAGYEAFEGAVPEDPLHHAIGAPYAHVTAPLRRLGDRFANEIALALCAGIAPPEWARRALPELPAILKASHRKDGELERRLVDHLEAAVLARHVGRRFEAVVVERDAKAATIQICEPAIVARCHGDCGSLGTTLQVRLTEADTRKGVVRFEPVI